MENTNVILGRQCETLWGKSYIEDYIGDIKMDFSLKYWFMDLLKDLNEAQQQASP